MGRMIGIDLGTTNSVVAVLDGPRPRVLDNRENKPQTRSVVSLKKRRGKKAGGDGEEILIGDPALDNWPMAPKDTIVSIKRLMGRGVNDREVQKVREWALYGIVQPCDGTQDSVHVVMGGKEYSPVDISAMVLKKMKEDAEFRLGEEVSHAVITVPAYFSQIQRAATRIAGVKAGMHVIKVLDEPTAAAIAFGMDSGDGTPKTLLVYDLGGGTFDISVLMWAGSVFAPLNLEGDMWLGGDNLDQVLVDHAVEYVKSEYGIDPVSNLRFMAELKKGAQAVKERLSSARSADLVLTGLLQDADSNLIDVEMEVTREEYERMILPLVGRYKQCACGQPNYPADGACAKCRKPLRSPVVDGRALQLVRRAIQNANLTPDQIDYVLMAGNSTAVPLVQQSMEETFGVEKVLRKVHPKHSVALGAAIVAVLIGIGKVSCDCGNLNESTATKCAACGVPLVPEAEREVVPQFEMEGFKIDDIGGIAPFHYGTLSAGDKFNIFIRKGDPFPTEDAQAQTQPFYTRLPNQRMISIPVYGGDNLEKASANEKQGEAFAMLPPGLPQDTVIRIKLWLDSDGVFKLTAHLENGADLEPWVVTGGADAKAIEAIGKVEQALAKKAELLSAEEKDQMEEARNRAFDRMKQGDYDGALQEAEQLGEMAAKAGRGEAKDVLTTKAENLIAFTEFVLHRYSWVLDPNQSYKLTNVLEEARGALESGDPAALEEKVEALDKATDNLPESIRVFIALRGAIASRIAPGDPALGAQLMEELDDVEESFKARSYTAGPKFAALAEKITKAISEVKAPVGLTCSHGHGVPPGERYCPSCGEDTWVLGSKATGTTTEMRRKRHGA